MTRRAPSLLLLLPLINLALLVLLSLLPSASFSAFDENEASWTRRRWGTAPFKLPLPFRTLRGGEQEEENREGAGQRKDNEAQSPSSSSSLSSPSSSPFPASSLLGPLSASLLALSAAAREEALARDEWEADERDASAASGALACDACRAAAARGWELGAGWVALQGRTEAKAAPNANAAADAKAPASAAPPAPPAHTETIFLLPAQLRQRLRRGIRSWCEREGEQGQRQGATSRLSFISPGSALEGAKLVREEEGGGGGGGRWRRVERPSSPEAAAAAAGGTAATAKATTTTTITSPRERLAARLACSSLLFSSSPPAPAVMTTTTAAAGTKKEAAPDPPVIAALADGLSLFAAALSRAANIPNANAKNDDNDDTKPPPPRLPPTLFPGRRPDLSGHICADFHPECAGWASLGECEANPGYMIGDDDRFLSNDDTNDHPDSSSSSSSSGGKDRGGGASSSAVTTSGHKRRRPGFCRFSCGVCSPMPRGFPAGAGRASLAAVARLPAESQEAAALEAEALGIREGVLLRACYAAKPCGGREGGEKSFGKWFEEEEEEDEKEEEEEKEGGKSNTNLVPSPISPSYTSPLHERCFVSAAGWWVYEVCVGGGIRQFHPPTSPRDAPAANLLGTFSSPSSETSPPAAKETKWLSAAELYRGGPLGEEAVGAPAESKVFALVEQRYEGGDPCGESEEEERKPTEVRRSATLRLACPSHASAREIDAVPRLLVAEPSTCVYVLTLFHPEACALVNGGGGAATKGEERAAAAVIAETTTTPTENAAAAAAAPPEADAAIPPPPPPAALAAARDEL